MAQVKCPKCGENAGCRQEEVGSSDMYIDKYTLTCNNCGHVESKEEDGGSTLGECSFTKCPYCGQSSEHHT